MVRKSNPDCVRKLLTSEKSVDFIIFTLADKVCGYYSIIAICCFHLYSYNIGFSFKWLWYPFSQRQSLKLLTAVANRQSMRMRLLLSSPCIPPLLDGAATSHANARPYLGRGGPKLEHTMP